MPAVDAVGTENEEKVKFYSENKIFTHTYVHTCNTRLSTVRLLLVSNAWDYRGRRIRRASLASAERKHERICFVLIVTVFRKSKDSPSI